MFISNGVSQLKSINKITNKPQTNMNKALATVLITLTSIAMTAKDKSPRPIYRDATAPIEQRVEDLLSLITLEEKVGQMSRSVKELKGFECVALKAKFEVK